MNIIFSFKTRQQITDIIGGQFQSKTIAYNVDARDMDGLKAIPWLNTSEETTADKLFLKASATSICTFEA